MSIGDTTTDTTEVAPGKDDELRPLRVQDSVLSAVIDDEEGEATHLTPIIELEDIEDKTRTEPRCRTKWTHHKKSNKLLRCIGNFSAACPAHIVATVLCVWYLVATCVTVLVIHRETERYSLLKGHITDLQQRVTLVERSIIIARSDSSSNSSNSGSDNSTFGLYGR